VNARFHRRTQNDSCLPALALHQAGDVDVVELEPELLQDLFGIALGNGEHQWAVGVEEAVFRNHQRRRR